MGVCYTRHACLFMLVFLLSLMATAERTAAAPNCNTTQCVEVQFAADANGVNKHCWMINSAKPKGMAYSAIYAENGYGNISIGGVPNTPIDGNTRAVQCTPDCNNGVSPVSGIVTTVVSTPLNRTFNTVCITGS